MFISHLFCLAEECEHNYVGSPMLCYIPIINSINSLANANCLWLEIEPCPEPLVFKEYVVFKKVFIKKKVSSTTMVIKFGLFFFCPVNKNY